MSILAVDDLFDTDAGAVDATYVDPDGNESDILVVLTREYQPTVHGEVEVENFHTVALCKDKDVSDANHSATLRVHPKILLEDESGYLTDENGNVLLADGQDQYSVIAVGPENQGLRALFLNKTN